jgi:hypothetical protein
MILHVPHGLRHGSTKVAFMEAMLPSGIALGEGSIHQGGSEVSNSTCPFRL